MKLMRDLKTIKRVKQKKYFHWRIKILKFIFFPGIEVVVSLVSIRRELRSLKKPPYFSQNKSRADFISLVSSRTQSSFPHLSEIRKINSVFHHVHTSSRHYHVVEERNSSLHLPIKIVIWSKKGRGDESIPRLQTHEDRSYFNTKSSVRSSLRNLSRL